MEEVGTNWDTVRLVISCLIGGMAAAQMKKTNAHENEEKAMGWAFVIVAIATFIFIKAVIVIAGLLAFLFLANALGPHIIQWASGAKNGISHEVQNWNTNRTPQGLPNYRLLEEVEEAIENGAQAHEIAEHIRRRKNGHQDRNGH